MEHCEPGIWMSEADDTTKDGGVADTALSSELRPDVLAGPANQRRRELLAAALFGAGPEAALVGRYRLLQRVGEGSMGLVYAAYDERLDRKVAVKLIRPGRQSSTEVHRRTLVEARALARLSHPNVVHVYEAGEVEGQIFVAMEFLAGPTLGGWLAERPRRWEEALPVLREAGQGLLAAHERGIVHRDFKPQNTIFGADGRVRVLDFGLARIGDADAEASGEVATATTTGLVLTRTGAVLGTPAYMAPEQFAGQPADARSDQFSFCVVAYEALYGERPFTGESLTALAESVTSGRYTRPSRRIPEWIHRAIARGLQVDPARRWASMAELLAALAEDPLRRRRMRRRVAIGAAGLTIAAVGATLLVRPDPAAELVAARDRHAEAAALAREAEALARARAALVEDPLAALRELRSLALAEPSHVRRAWTIAAAALARGVPERLASGPAAAIHDLALASTGRMFALDASGEVWRWEVGAREGVRVATIVGLPTEIATTAAGDRWVAWSDVGAESGDADGALQWRHAAGEAPQLHNFIAADERRVVSYHPEVRAGRPQARDLRTGEAIVDAFPRVAWADDARVAVAGDGRRMAWARPGAAEISVWADGQATRALAAPGRFVMFPQAGFLGEFVVGMVSDDAAWQAGERWAQPAEGSQSAAVWDLAAGSGQLLARGEWLLGALPEGRALFVHDGSGDAVVRARDLATREVRWEVELGRAGFFNVASSVSADGSMFAIQTGDRRQRGARTLLGDVRGGGVIRELQHPEAFAGGAFAGAAFVVPSGRQIATWAARSGGHSVVDLAPGRAVAPTTLQVSSRGQALVRMGAAGGERIDPATGATTPLAACPGIDAEWNSLRVDDGGRVLQAGATQACVYAAGAGEPRVIDGPGGALRGLALAPDGRGLALADVDGAGLVWSDLDAPPRRISTGAGRALLMFTPDGRGLASSGASGLQLHIDATSRQVLPAAPDGLGFTPTALLALRCAGRELLSHALVDGEVRRYPLPDCHGSTFLRVAADGRRAAIVDDAGLAVIDLEDGSRRTYEVPISGPDFAFTADGQALIGGFFDGVGLVDLVSGEAVPLAATNRVPPVFAVGEAWVALWADQVHRWTPPPTTSAGLRAWLEVAGVE